MGRRSESNAQPECFDDFEVGILLFSRLLIVRAYRSANRLDSDTMPDPKSGL
jgi:hypothetical protein